MPALQFSSCPIISTELAIPAAHDASPFITLFRISASFEFISYRDRHHLTSQPLIQKNVFDLSDACVRSSWAVILPFAVAVLFAVSALPAEVVVDVQIHTEDIEVEPASLWRARIFAFVGVLQTLAWSGLAFVVFNQKDEPTTTSLIQLGFLAGSWLYTAVRSIASPPQTAPYDLFVIYTLQAIGAAVVLGGLLFDNAFGGASLPSQGILVGLGVYAAMTAVMLYLVVEMPMNIPSTRVDKTDIGKTVSPEDYTTISQWMTFSWVYPLVKKGTHNTLNEIDVWNMSPTMQSLPVFVKFQTIYRSTLLRRVIAANSFDIIIDFIVTILGIFFEYAGPFLLKQLLDVLEQKNPSPRDKALAHLLAALIRRTTARVRSQLMAAIYDKALKRKDFSGVVKEKEKDDGKTKAESAGKEEEKAKSSADVGKIVNLMSSDAEDLSFIASSIYMLYGAPFEVAIGSVFLYQLLGWSAFAGFVPLFAIMPINRLLTAVTVKLYEGKKKAADKRMALVDELIAAVKFIKFFAWEDRWTERVMEAREEEMGFMVQQRLYTTIFNGVWNFGPLAHSLVSFAVYVYLGNELTVAKAFTALAIFSSIRNPLNIVPTYIVHLLRSAVALKRIANFLEEDEVTEQVSTIKQDFAAATIVHQGLGLENATLEWNQVKEDDKTTTAASVPKSAASSVADVSTLADSEIRDHHFELKNISVLFPENKLSVITGPTASGKTALLMALMGEMSLLPGGRIIMAKDSTVDEHGHTHGIAYAAQTPWLQHRSIKDNILFGSPMEEARYKEVVRCCALQPDFEVLEDGDLTEIGVKGVSLSGGQKARVALARAVYSRKRYVLLDDPLSAVDSHTSRFLYENCLRGPLLATRTVVLVTHHLELVLPAAHHLIRMLDGRIDAQGTVGELRSQGVLEDIKHEAAAEAEKEEQAIVAEAVDATADTTAEPKKPRKLVEDEHREVGTVKWSVYQAYLLASGYWVWILLAALATMQNVQRVSEKLWFKFWAAGYDAAPNMHMMQTQSAYDGAAQVFLLPSGNSAVHVTSLPNAATHPLFYIGVYTAIGVAGVALQLLGGWVQYTGALAASRVLFKKLLFTVTRATFRFHDTTPQGRILNRFSKDFNTIDGELSGSLYAVTSSLSAFFVSIITVAIVIPPFLLPATFLSIGYWWLANGYLSTGRDLRRMESNSRSPIFSDFGELLSGLVTVRAFSAEKRFMQGLHQRIDEMAKTWYAFWMSSRWLLINFDVLGGVAVYLTTLFTILVVDDAGLAGLAITSALTFSDSVYWTCRFWTELELNLNSVERISEYLDLPQEPPAIVESNRPPAYWPSSSANDSLVVAEDVHLKYAPDLPSVLHGVSFKLKAGERIGLVGRTGSGKSTLAMSLLRFVDPSSGKIVVDGVDISKIGIYDLRSRMTFIPQDATLFSGTLRDNLDPFGDHEDSVCIDVLRRVHLLTRGDTPLQGQSRVASTAGSREVSRPASLHEHADNSETLSTTLTSVDGKPTTLSLDTQVSAGGSNFSQGQRQLIAMARALLRRSAIVVMDEATSSVDFETDAKIQQTIREEFAGSLLITVAHRLKTIIDYDRVMVLDKGKIVEFDRPSSLIQRESSVFRGMCVKSGTFAELEAAAKRAFEAHG
ncbi:ATP-dependent bile acid permease [Mycena indigotica]|uniref:ATP-dependent bile acid permease n=1 Tax=Mycena indigotica TaxID=2126181 RepID=A0A8H6W201_9AGAR|nr:ATP-dependent bile acid permease [Mycena indigotica]KAF7298743.1 ATP-dependent bile acid permease [Mycena indigotica]